MELLKKISRLVFFTVLLSLLLGIANLQTQPLLIAFLAVIVAIRARELMHEAPEGLIHWYRSEQHPRWVVWTSGMSFLTNLVLPILDHRYRGEVFWSSPLPQASWWVALLGLLLLIGGSVLRLRTIVVTQAPQPAAATPESKRKRKANWAETETEPRPAPSFRLEPAFYYATALSYFGIAVCFTSIWSALAIFIVILPPLFSGKSAQTSMATS